MRVIKRALLNPEDLNKFESKIFEKFDDEWKCLLEVKLNLEEIKRVQKNMTKHYENPIPWYMDGYFADDKDKIIVAFGADDGYGGRIFTFDRSDKDAYQKMKEHAFSVGIFEEQIDFMDK